MTRRFLLAATFALLGSPAAADGAATLNVTVENIGDAGGELRIGVYDQAGFSARNAMPVAGKIVPARSSKMTVRIENIPPGIYGVKLFQDIDRNGYLDLSVRGVEPFGFSNDPPVTTGLPAFDDVKFTLSPGDNSITVTLH